MFQILALPMEPFERLFLLNDRELAARGAQRVFADVQPGFPCRVSLQDAQIAEELVLCNYRHLEGDTPYVASHAIYVRRNAIRACPAPGEVPEVLASRLLSVRAFDERKLMIAADVVEGADLSAALETMMADGSVDFAHIHNARQGCFAAAATRV